MVFLLVVSLLPSGRFLQQRTKLWPKTLLTPVSLWNSSANISLLCSKEEAQLSTQEHHPLSCTWKHVGEEGLRLPGCPRAVRAVQTGSEQGERKANGNMLLVTWAWETPTEDHNQKQTGALKPCCRSLHDS